MRFEMGGTEEQRLLVVTMKRMCPTEPMAVFDHHGSMLYANTVFAHMVGYDVDKMAGMKISKLMAEPYGYLHHRWIREQVRGGQGRGGEDRAWSDAPERRPGHGRCRRCPGCCEGTECEHRCWVRVRQQLCRVGPGDSSPLMLLP